MRCAEIMNGNVIVVHEEDTVQTAARLMRTWDLEFLPVCDSQERVVGTLTDRDIVVRVCAEDWQASTCPVRDVMSSQVVVCRPEDDVESADALLSEFEQPRILVVDRDDTVRGVITAEDLAERAAFLAPVRPSRVPPEA